MGFAIAKITNAGKTALVVSEPVFPGFFCFFFSLNTWRSL